MLISYAMIETKHSRSLRTSASSWSLRETFKIRVPCPCGPSLRFNKLSLTLLPDKFGSNRSFILPCAAIICHLVISVTVFPLNPISSFITQLGCEHQGGSSLCRVSLSSPLCPWSLFPAMTHGECSINVGQRGEVMNGENPCHLIMPEGKQALGTQEAGFLYGSLGLWSSMGPLPWQIICKPWRDPYG